LDFEELQELIRILEESGLAEIEVEEEGRRIRLQKSGPPAVLQLVAAVPEVAPTSQAPLSPNPSAAEIEEPDEALGMPTIDAPMVGTFYAASAPGEEPFVQVGDTVEENQTVCIVEAMKLMNEIGAKFAGIIEKVLVENGQPVEFGQPLFAIRAVE
jgi:acetyl-CoA carboxylase biotin carboxyl carrier protein